MAVQSTHRFNVEDYYRMAETGVLRPDVRVELLDGEIIDMSPIGPSHGSALKYLLKCFSREDSDRWLLSIQDPIRLDDQSEPQPDLMLTRSSEGYYNVKHPTAEDVFLLVEVSDSTLEFDRSKKIPAYGRAGVPEVWIVNLVERTLEVYREPNYTGYAAKTVLRSGDFAHPAAFPDVSVDLAALLKLAK
jgi:hypothetical protein